MSLNPIQIPRLETRHWCIIIIGLILCVAMITHTPIQTIKEVIIGLGGLGGLDFGIKRIKDRKTP